jgi:uncharacterized protein (DUF427 family)
VSLTSGNGPLGNARAGRFSAPVPAGTVYVEPHPRRIRAVVDGATAIDTERALMVHRAGRPLAYVFPLDEVGDLPHEPEAEADGYVHVPWDAVDEWYEEGRRLVSYPPNPYHRIDCRPTRRRLRVEVEGAVLVDTDDTVILFETSLAPKLYVAPGLVRTDLLRPSATRTYCNYKGVASYWDAVVGGAVVADVAWSYEDALPESSPVEGHLSFDPTRCTVEAELPDAGPVAIACTTECAAPPTRPSA